MTHPQLFERLDDGPLAVETRSLVKRFGRRAALDGLELTVPEGAIYVLVGPNGAGKTTALRILLDLIRPEAGEARVLSHDIRSRGPAIRAAVGYVPEDHDFGVGDLRVEHILAHHAAYFSGWDDDYAARLSDGLGVNRRVRYGTLSKGQARRVQLVLALAHRPDLLLLDEPTDGLDPLARDQVFGILADHLATSPATVVISTHLVHEVEGLGDVLGVLTNGRLVAQQRRDTFGRYLHRVRFDTPESWAAPAGLGDALLERSEAGRERVWTLWGPPEDTRGALQSAGATVRAVERLNLEDTTRTLLRRATR